MSASNTPAWVGLAGVAIGFFLGEGSRYVRYRLDIRRNRKIIKSELQSILAQIPLKRDILQQAIKHLKTRQILPTKSVHMVAVGYYSVLKDLYPHLKPVERNCLHVIFEHLRVAEELLDGFVDSIESAVKNKIISDPWVVFSDQLQDILGSYDQVENLIRSYLLGNPIDVFNIAKN